MERYHKDVWTEDSNYPDDKKSKEDAHAKKKKKKRKEKENSPPAGSEEEEKEEEDKEAQKETKEKKKKKKKEKKKKKKKKKKKGEMQKQSEERSHEVIKWGCPCTRVAFGRIPSGTKLQSRKQKTRNMIVWVCDALTVECTEGQSTAVAALPATIQRVEVRDSTKGAWVKFDQHGPAKTATTLSPAPSSHNCDVNELADGEMLIYSVAEEGGSARCTEVGKVIGVDADQELAEVHRYGTYRDGLWGTFAPAFTDATDKKDVYTNKQLARYVPIIDHVKPTEILARGFDLEKGVLPRDVVQTVQTGVASDEVWYEEGLLYLSADTAQCGLVEMQRQMEDQGEDDRQHIKFLGEFKEAESKEQSEYEKRILANIAENQTQLDALMEGVPRGQQLTQVSEQGPQVSAKRSRIPRVQAPLRRSQRTLQPLPKKGLMAGGSSSSASSGTSSSSSSSVSESSCSSGSSLDRSDTDNSSDSSDSSDSSSE
jgi:hypothetical protein